MDVYRELAHNCNSRAEETECDSCGSQSRKVRDDNNTSLSDSVTE